MLSEIQKGTVESNISAEFCGNRDIKALLSEIIRSGRIPHAFIIEGDDGLGKTTLAHLIARGAVCTCDIPMNGECSHCRKMKARIHPDLIYVKGSGKTNAISIDTIREMRKDSQTAPNEAERRVFLLEDCDNMLPPAQNAFLKIFEEAPSHVIFIMTCKSAMNLLTTIRSRGRIITLHPVMPEEGAEFLRGIYPNLSSEQAINICTQSGGNIGEALRLAGNSEGDDFADKVSVICEAIINAVCANNEFELTAECARIGKDRTMGAAVVERLCEGIRQALMVSVGAQDILNSPSQDILRLGTLRSSDILIKYLQELSELKDSLKINVSMMLFNTRLAVILQQR